MLLVRMTVSQVPRMSPAYPLQRRLTEVYKLEGNYKLDPTSVKWTTPEGVAVPPPGPRDQAPPASPEPTAPTAEVYAGAAATPPEASLPDRESLGDQSETDSIFDDPYYAERTNRVIDLGSSQ